MPAGLFNRVVASIRQIDACVPSCHNDYLHIPMSGMSSMMSAHNEETAQYLARERGHVAFGKEGWRKHACHNASHVAGAERRDEGDARRHDAEFKNDPIKVR